jgi:ribosomal small subunit protein bTHX
MGKGDKKSKRGKLAKGTFGKSRLRASKSKVKTPVKSK